MVILLARRRCRRRQLRAGTRHPPDSSSLALKWSSWVSRRSSGSRIDGQQPSHMAQKAQMARL